MTANAVTATATVAVAVIVVIADDMANPVKDRTHEGDAFEVWAACCL